MFYGKEMDAITNKIKKVSERMDKFERISDIIERNICPFDKEFKYRHDHEDLEDNILELCRDMNDLQNKLKNISKSVDKLIGSQDSKYKKGDKVLFEKRIAVITDIEYESESNDYIYKLSYLNNDESMTVERVTAYEKDIKEPTGEEMDLILTSKNT